MITAILTIVGSLLTYFVGRWFKSQIQSFFQARKREFDQEQMKKQLERATGDTARLGSQLDSNEDFAKRQRDAAEALQAELNKELDGSRGPNLN